MSALSYEIRLIRMEVVATHQVETKSSKEFYPQENKTVNMAYLKYDCLAALIMPRVLSESYSIRTHYASDNGLLYFKRFNNCPMVCLQCTQHLVGYIVVRPIQARLHQI